MEGRSNIKIYLKLFFLLLWVALVCTNIDSSLVIFVQLVGRLSQEELIDQLPTFLPALFDAFNNQSPDVRKVGTNDDVDKMCLCFPLILYMTSQLLGDLFVCIDSLNSFLIHCFCHSYLII